jgi:predicted HTH domain antitoxin
MNALKIQIELPGDLMAALNIPESDLGRRAKEWVVLELFQEGEISAGKAAEILGMPKVGFLDLLDRRNLPYLDASPQELESDLAAARAAAKPIQG